MRHVCDQTGECPSQGACKCIEKGFDRRLEILAQAPRVRCRIVTHLAQHCVGDQVSLAGPAPVNAGAGTLYLACDAIDGYRPIATGPQGA